MITNGSGNYEYSINDKEGLEFLSEEDGKFITFKGLKEGIYKVKVIDKATNENAVVTIKVLPQAIEIDALMRKVDDPLFCLMQYKVPIHLSLLSLMDIMNL